jgi:thioredoxin reductase
MNDNNDFDVIIVGGSYSGLAAAMALGRALKKVLVIDSGKPCNLQTPHSHNFLTRDGTTPAEIARLGKQQVSKYSTITFFSGLATNARRTRKGFEIAVDSGEKFHAPNIIFATGIRDLLPPITGLHACWGISVLHCPYCHGYEVSGKKTGIIGNGEEVYQLAKLISNWTNQLTIFTDDISSMTEEQTIQLVKNNIRIVEKQIERLEHDAGYVRNIHFTDGTSSSIDAIYIRPPFEEHCPIPKIVGCAFTVEGYISVDSSQETSVKGVFACGDNVTQMRTVANAVAMGTAAGIAVSKQIILGDF